MSKSDSKKKDVKIKLIQITDIVELQRMLKDEKDKLLQVRLDVKMGKEKNNQLISLSRTYIAQILTRIKQLEILNSFQKGQ